MKFLRASLPAVARLAALAVLASHVVLTTASAHVLCAAAKHDCGSPTRISACCCGENTETSRAAGPIVAAVRVAPTPSTVAPPAVRFAPPIARPLPSEGAPLSAVPDDLTILLANLRV